MNELALCSIALRDLPLNEVAAIAAAAGLKAIEITGRLPHLDPKLGAPAARLAAETVAAAGVRVLAYGSYLGFGDQECEPEREAEIASALGAHLFRVWARGGDVERAAKVVRAACDAAPGMTVVVERHSGSLADTADRIEAFLGLVDRPNAGLNWQVLDFLTMDQSTHQPADATRLARFTKYVHLKNYRAGNGQMQPWESLENGILDYKAILQALVGAGYKGPLAIEFLPDVGKSPFELLSADVAFVRRVLEEVLA